MNATGHFSINNIPFDLLIALVVTLVALPLNLGIASASGAPVASGSLAGIIGGIVVGILSQSQTNVTSPAAKCQSFKQMDDGQKDAFADIVAERNVWCVVEETKKRNARIRQAAEDSELLVIGAICDVDDGRFTFQNDQGK